MRVVKPLTQSLLHRKFDYDKKSYVSIISAVFFDFKTQTLCSEQDLWKHFGEECLTHFDVEVLDLMGRKKTPEIIINGYAYGKYAEQGKTTVQVRLNNVLKSLHVWGDRYWVDGQATEPQPFDRIPINWKNAYGGAGFDKNPKGKGRDAVDVGDMRFVPLPNIESPSAPIKHQREVYDPVTFTSLPMEYPERNLLMGSYDEQWRQEEFPGLAKDVDWAYFNQSPSDQRLAKLEAGDQALFVNMHPEQADYVMTIPALRHKAFIRLVKDKHKSSEFLNQVDLKLTTLWAFPHLEKAFLIYEGVVEIPRWFFVDDIIAELMGAIEHPDRPKPLSYYEEVFKLRTDEDASMHYAMLDKQLVDEAYLRPAARIPLSLSLKYKLKRLIEELRPLEAQESENQAKLKALIEEEGIDIEGFSIESFLMEHFGENVRTLDALQAMLEEGLDIEEESLRQLEQERQEKSFREQAREFKQELKKISSDGETKKMSRQAFLEAQEEHAAHQAEYREEYKEKTPENLARAQEALDTIRQDNKSLAHIFQGYTAEQFMDYQASGAILPKRNFNVLGGDDGTPSDSPYYDQFALKEQQKNAWLEKVANPYQMPLDSFSDLDESTAFEIDSLEFFLDAKAVFLKGGGGFHLTGTGVDTVTFDEVSVQELKAEHRHFLNCQFNQGQIAASQFRHCVFENCRFVGVTLEDCDFNQCQFIDCEWVNASIEKSYFKACQYEQCLFKTSDFNASTLQQVDFINAEFDMGDFTRSRLWGVKWLNSQLTQTSVTLGVMRDIVLEACKVESLGIVLDTVINRWHIIDCQLSKVFIKAGTGIAELLVDSSSDRDSSWRELSISQARIVNSQLESNDFSKTHFQHAEFVDISFKESMWMSSTLEKVRLKNVDFAEAVMMGFKSIDSYFKHVSFFTAEMSYIDIDNKTIFDDCYMERVNTVPKLRG